MAIPIPERRRHPRIKRKWFVHFMLAKSSTQEWGIGRVNNLSLGGVAFNCNERIEVQEQLKMKFNLPVPALQFVLGKVIWRKKTGTQQYVYGVIFEKLNAKDVTSLQGLVIQLLKDH